MSDLVGNQKTGFLVSWLLCLSSNMKSAQNGDSCVQKIYGDGTLILSHLTEWRNWGLNLQPLVYKASG